MAVREFSVFTGEEILARCMWGEARSESPHAMYAVGWVARNRKEDKRRRWPNTYSGVILQPRQFSAFNLGDPNRQKILNIGRLRKGANLRAWHLACDSAHELCRLPDLGRDPTHGGNHYHDTSIKPPYWARGQEPTVEIGRLVFYRL